MASTPPLIDYTKLTPLKLRDLRGRYEAQGYPHLALDCTKELLRRGAARSADYSNLQWNQDKVRALFVPFRALAAFEGNERTSYTEAGGSRIGHKKSDPEWMWIDSYSGMAVSHANWVFSCQIPQPGDDPTFSLIDHKIVVRTYNSDGVAAALKEWAELAAATRKLLSSKS